VNLIDSSYVNASALAPALPPGYDIVCPLMGGDGHSENYYARSCKLRQAARPRDCDGNCLHRLVLLSPEEIRSRAVPVKAPSVPKSRAPNGVWTGCKMVGCSRKVMSWNRRGLCSGCVIRLRAWEGRGAHGPAPIVRHEDGLWRNNPSYAPWAGVRGAKPVVHKP
jgi:hypothetical protein